MTNPSELSAFAARAAIASGELTAGQLVRDCLRRIDAREPQVRAFAFLDPERAISQARMLDRRRPQGPLHGIPIGVKDIIDTCDMPTGLGSPIYSGRRPQWDASCVALCRAAGALILGKTVSSEFAGLTPGKTCNPRNPNHTPGGSSQGSAAAVADFMLPFALGTQTGGSITRPAAYCGVVGYKATFGSFDLEGVCGLARSLDTLGFFTRDLRDVLMFRRVLCGDLAEIPASPPEEPPRIGFVRTPYWLDASPSMRGVLEATASKLADEGAILSEPALPASFDELAAHHKRMLAFEAAQSRAYEYFSHREQLSEELITLIETGLRVSYQDYEDTQRAADEARSALDELFLGNDVLLSPAAPCEAPRGLMSTGDPIFSRMWTLLHVPSLTLPTGTGPNGLPLAIQIVGRRRLDTTLVLNAMWVQARL